MKTVRDQRVQTLKGTNYEKTMTVLQGVSVAQAEAYGFPTQESFYSPIQIPCPCRMASLSLENSEQDKTIIIPLPSLCINLSS